MKTTIDESGRIELPEVLRKQLGLNPGDDVELVERAGEWVIRSPQEDTGLCWEGNVLVHKGRTETGATVDEVVGQARDERFRELSEGLGE